VLVFAAPVRALGEADVLTTQIAEVLPVVVDYANFVHFMSNFAKSRALAQRGNRAIAHMEMSVASGTFTLCGRLKLAEAAPDRDSGVIEARLLKASRCCSRESCSPSRVWSSSCRAWSASLTQQPWASKAALPCRHRDRWLKSALGPSFHCINLVGIA